MPVVGAHVLLYTPEPERLRAALREALGWTSVEAYDPPDGWQIFALPPAELGVHPADAPRHELALMCRDLPATIEELRAKGLEVRGEPVDEGWGTWVTLVLPGGVGVLLYDPRHATPLDV